ncbi:unnamed protein product [Didymodactylos carnosus]|uniref:Trehalase n=1 Tax=Didymodactylos carnosus TaxID=1234261 RepID=A0A815RKP1_9BILA|nr:unnamed protein product [Didymodactylos carnosus]CAF1477740.1 unnamed protein product [Didymodactylos carnosus]CAF4178100.1 unnamed protein product [Didymodactylos carnosus]CAF4343451.1 unnamed protein product [Didymodactylos carnosus]
MLFLYSILAVTLASLLLNVHGQSPDELYQELFVDVQLNRIFKDSKTFSDCIPLRSPQQILELYRNRTVTNFNLTEFVQKNFQEPPPPIELLPEHANWTIVEHCHRLWPYLIRNSTTSDSSLLVLPNSFIIPGGRFRESYYWDAYFIMLGLKQSNYSQLISNMVENFAYLIRKYNHIPNGNRDYYLSRSQPPFFSLMIELLDSIVDEDLLVKYISELEQEYAFWMNNNGLTTGANRRLVQLPDGTKLNRYYDDISRPRPESYYEDYHTANNDTEIYLNIRAAAESGWDFSTRWMINETDLSTIITTQILPIDLNCLMFNLEQVLSQAYQHKHDQSKSDSYAQLADKRKEAIIKYFWSDKENFFMDYNFVQGTHTRSISLAAMFPLWMKIATNQQAKHVIDKIEQLFLKDGGLITTVSENSHQQWDAPNGWAPLQYISYKGIQNYEPTSPLIKEIINRWMKRNEQVFEKSGKMVEKYDVVNMNLDAGGGEYPTQVSLKFI